MGVRYVLPAQEIDLSSSPSSSVLFLYLDTYTGLCNVCPQGEGRTVITAHRIVFASMHILRNLVWNISNYSINGSNKESPLLYPVYNNEYVLDSPINGIYSAGDYADGGPDTENPITSMLCSELFDLYDALVSTYPDYITKTFLGNEATGLPLYRYDFQPTMPPSNSTLFPKIFITSGTHCEKTGVWGVYNTMKAICENWETDPLLEILRWNVNFIVVPIVNPYGFNNITRKNSNGVDLNRNQTAGWTNTELPESEWYGGIAPLSELESQYINNILLTNTDITFYVDFHNYGTPSAHPHDFIWVAAPYIFGNQSYFMQTLGKSLISKMSRKWKKEQNSFPQDNTTMFGYTGPLDGGTIAYQAATYGYVATDFEVANILPDEISPHIDSALVTKYATEVFTNLLLLVLKKLIK